MGFALNRTDRTSGSMVHDSHDGARGQLAFRRNITANLAGAAPSSNIMCLLQSLTRDDVRGADDEKHDREDDEECIHGSSYWTSRIVDARRLSTLVRTARTVTRPR